MPTNELSLIPLRNAVLCVSCHTISNTPHTQCPACGDSGCLLPLYNTVLGKNAVLPVLQAATARQHNPATCSDGLCRHPQCMANMRAEWASRQLNQG